MANGTPIVVKGFNWASFGATFDASQDVLEETYDLAIEFGQYTLGAPSNNLIPTQQFKWRNEAAFERDFTQQLPDFFTPGENALSACDQEHFSMQWLLLGSKGGGSVFHFDSYNTSAWSILLAGGKKHWALYPPPTIPSGMPSPDTLDKKAQQLPENQRYLLYADHGRTKRAGSAVGWFEQVLPTLSAEEQPLQCTVGIGDIVYVPPGWWHAVNNLEDNIAFTANFVGLDARSITASVRSMGHQLERGINHVPREVLQPCLSAVQGQLGGRSELR